MFEKLAFHIQQAVLTKLAMIPKLKPIKSMNTIGTRLKNLFNPGGLGQTSDIAEVGARLPFGGTDAWRFSSHFRGDPVGTYRMRINDVANTAQRSMPEFIQAGIDRIIARRLGVDWPQ